MGKLGLQRSVNAAVPKRHPEVYIKMIENNRMLRRTIPATSILPSQELSGIMTPVTSSQAQIETSEGKNTCSPKRVNHYWRPRNDPFSA